MICIISGPSCAGKSTFLKSSTLKLLTETVGSSPCLFPSDIMSYSNNISRDNYYLHYNILRTASISDHSRINSVNSDPYAYSTDKAWDIVRKIPVRKSAVVLVTARSELIQRMSSRDSLEMMLRKLSSYRYPKSYWLSILAQLDLNVLYTSWCNELKNHKIPFTLIDSSSPKYEIVSEARLNAINLNQ